MTQTTTTDRSGDRITPGIWVGAFTALVLVAPTPVTLVLLLAAQAIAVVEFLGLQFRGLEHGRSDGLIVYPYVTLAGITYLLGMAFILSHIKENYGAVAALYVIVVTYAFDVVSLYGGKALGHHGAKLAPGISAGKTRIGVFCGLAGALCATLPFFLFGWSGGHGVVIFVWTLALCITALAGDLLESILKRRAGAKDSGTLLRGMGGVLDRVDAITMNSWVALWLFSHQLLG